MTRCSFSPTESPEASGAAKSSARPASGDVGAGAPRFLRRGLRERFLREVAENEAAPDDSTVLVARALPAPA